MLDEKTIRNMISAAIGQLAFSYTPYSYFKVGAALLAENGEIYTAILKMRHMPRQTVRNGRLFLKRSARESKISRQSASLAEKTAY